MATIFSLEDLNKRIKIISTWNHRNIYANIIEFLQNDDFEKFFVLRGLRRTGKTTVALQALASPEAKKLGKSAVMLVGYGDRISLLTSKIRQLYSDGVRVILIYEATRALDLAEASSILPDVFAGMGMKILLTGTDSLKFVFARRDGLFDRDMGVQTTYI